MKTLTRTDVDKVLKLKSEGYTQADIAELLDSDGYKNPSGRKLHQSDISLFMIKFGERQKKRKKKYKKRKVVGGNPVSTASAKPPKATDHITKILTDLVIGLSAKRKAELLIQLVK